MLRGARYEVRGKRSYNHIDTILLFFQAVFFIRAAGYGIRGTGCVVSASNVVQTHLSLFISLPVVFNILYIFIDLSSKHIVFID